MAFVCELGDSQRLYLDNQGTQTAIALTSSQVGQQQQSSQSIQTGSWTSPPEVFRVANGAVLKIQATQGEYFIQIQGSRIGMLSAPPGLSNAQQIQLQRVTNAPSLPPLASMPPLKPLPPLKMGNMQMSMNPMEMRMGDMTLRMPADADSPEPSIRRFCSQCGVSVQPSDRFCSSCGHDLA